MDEGEGPVVLFVHGNPSWSFMFRDLILSLRSRFRCLAPDHRGCGLSDRQTRSLRMRDHSENLGSVLDSLGVDRYLLVAHDWGGAIGAHRAGLEPDRLAGLVFANTAAFPVRRMPWQIRLARMPILGRLLVEKMNLFAKGAVRKGVVREMSRAVADGFHFPWVDPQARKTVTRFVRDIPWSCRHPSRSALDEADRGLVRLRAKPCLLLWGMRDFCFDEVFLNEWIGRFPEAEVVRFPEAGHYVFEDAGAAAKDRILRFTEKTFGVEA